MYLLMRTQTNQPRKNNPNHTWYTYNRDEKKFRTMEEVRDWLKSEYGDCRREKMYRDAENAKTMQAGWIYCYKAEPSSYDDCHHFMQDWIEVQEYTPVTVIV